jgi:hypothetical protein
VLLLVLLLQPMAERLKLLLKLLVLRLVPLLRLLEPTLRK